MKFRKLLAFVLVFSVVAQPSDVHLLYAQDTKAAEVKIEEKTEASGELVIDEAELDEYLFDPGSREQKLEDVAAEKTAKTSKISGALAGAIAAGVAAVTAAVGTAGLMVYNGVSNKDEIAQLWKSEEGSFFSRLGKTISILFKGSSKRNPTGIDSYDNYLAGEGALAAEGVTSADDAEVYKEKERLAKEEALLLENNKTVLRNGVNSLQSRVDALNDKHKGDLQDELNAVKNTIETATTVEALEGVDGQLTTLVVKVAKAEAAQQKAEDDARKLKELNDKKSALSETVNTLQGRIDALKEEHKGSLQDELNTVKNTIETATTVEALEGVEGQLTTLVVKVAEAEAAQQKAENEAKEEEERKKKEQKLAAAKANGQTKLTELEKAINAAGGKGGEAFTAAENLKNELTNAINDQDATADSINAVANKVDGVVKALNSAVTAQVKAEKQAQEQELEAAKTNGQTKLKELEKAINAAGDKGGEALTDAQALKTELNNALNNPNATAEAINDAANKVDGLVKALNSAVTAQVEAEKKEQEQEQKLETAKQNGQEKLNKLTSAINAADGKGGEALTAANDLKNELINAINAPDATADSINTVANKVDGVVNRLKVSRKVAELADIPCCDAAYYEGRILDILKKPETEHANRFDGLLSSLNENHKNSDLKKLSSLNKDIDKLISDFGVYKESYVSQYKKKYADKCEELKQMRDAGVAVTELGTYKDDLQKKLNSLKEFCKNNPDKCKKQ